jgi:hypothetical protein
MKGCLRLLGFPVSVVRFASALRNRDQFNGGDGCGLYACRPPFRFDGAFESGMMKPLDRIKGRRSMDLTLPIEQMTTAEKLRALEAIWESLCREPNDVPSPSWHEDVLQERAKSVQEGSSQFTDWPQAKQDIRDVRK